VSQCQKRTSGLYGAREDWTLRCKGRLTEADTPTIWLGATPSEITSAHLHHPPFFYRLNALPAAQPTVSEHSGHLFHAKDFVAMQLTSEINVDHLMMTYCIE